MFLYENNKKIKNEIKKIVADEGISMTILSEKLDISAQQLNNYFNKKNFSLSDLKKIMNAINYDIEINFKKK